MKKPLTDDEIKQIIALKGKFTQKELAIKFGRSQPIISQIQRGVLYRQARGDVTIPIMSEFGQASLESIWPHINDEARFYINCVLNRLLDKARKGD